MLQELPVEGLETEDDYIDDYPFDESPISDWKHHESLVGNIDRGYPPARPAYRDSIIWQEQSKAVHNNNCSRTFSPAISVPVQYEEHVL